MWDPLRQEPLEKELSRGTLSLGRGLQVSEPPARTSRKARYPGSPNTRRAQDPGGWSRAAGSNLFPLTQVLRHKLTEGKGPLGTSPGLRLLHSAPELRRPQERNPWPTQGRGERQLREVHFPAVKP